MGGLLFAAVAMIYFRLLGRLAWHCSIEPEEEAEGDEESPEDGPIEAMTHANPPRRPPIRLRRAAASLRRDSSAALPRCCWESPPGAAAAWIEQVRAPLLVFPLLVGVAIGLSLAALMRLARYRPSPDARRRCGAGRADRRCRGALLSLSRLPPRSRRLSGAEKRRHVSALSLDALPDTAPGFARYMRGQAEQGRQVVPQTKFAKFAAGMMLRGPLAWASWALDGTSFLLASAIAAVSRFQPRP